MHPDPVAVGVAHAVLLVERHTGSARGARGLVDPRLVLGVDEIEPRVRVVQERGWPGSREASRSGAEEGHRHTGGLRDVDVGDGGDRSTTPRYRVSASRSLASWCWRPIAAPDHGRGRARAVQVGEAPRSGTVAVLEPDRAPPRALDRDRVVGERRDAVTPQDSAVRVPGTSRRRRSTGWPLSNASVQRSKPGGDGAVRPGHATGRGDARGAPFRHGCLADDVRRRRSARTTTARETRAAIPNRASTSSIASRQSADEQQSLGGEGDGLEHRVAAQRRRAGVWATASATLVTPALDDHDEPTALGPLGGLSAQVGRGGVPIGGGSSLVRTG